MTNFRRVGGVCVLALFIVGCSSPAPESPYSSRVTPSGKIVRSDQCRYDPQSCMYEGSYEPNERAYAEQRAKELNRASANRLRRNSIGAKPKRKRGWW